MKRILFVLAVLVTLGIACGESTVQNSNVPQIPPTSESAWVPAGFDLLNDQIAFRWLTGKSCSYGAKCTHAEFYARYGCPNALYVEVAKLDSKGSQVDWTNDMSTSVPVGGRVILEFITFNTAAVKTQITKVSCY
jgi:hypothetical protein